MGNIPSLSYTVTHAVDRLRRNAEYIDDEIRTTRKLVIGHPDVFETSSYGVVSVDDPSSHTSGSSDPLVVSTNASNPLTLDVNPGIAVMSSGVYIQVHDIVRGVSLADPSLDVPNVVFLQYLLDEAPPVPNFWKQTTTTPYTYRYGDPNDANVINSQDVLIDVVTVDTWNTFSATTKSDYCPLAVVTTQNVVSGGVTTTQLSIDSSQGTYSFNRPWFSVADVFHRSLVGTGGVTDSNPHGIGPNDFVVGDLSFFDTHLDHGIVVSKDRSIARVPGYRCQSAIVQVLTDDASGTLTGYASADYIELPYFPVRVGRVWRNSNGEDLAAVRVPETHRVVFPSESAPVGETINVYYTRAEAGEPPLPGATSFVTQGPASEELVIAGGLGLTQLTTVEETFADTGQFPMRYDIFTDGNGTILKTPQPIYCRKRLDTLGTTDSITITPYGPARLMVGLVGAASVPTLSVKVKLFGTDASGTNIDEEFAFTQATWTDPTPIPLLPIPTSNAVQFGTKIFTTVTSISVTERTDDGPNSAVMVWMLHNPYDTYDNMNNAVHLATVDWDGTGMANVFDKRRVATNVRNELINYSGAETQRFFLNLLVGGNQTVFVEDFMAPRYHSLITESELADLSMLVRGLYPNYQMSKLQDGINGFYRSIAFPVSSGSGTTWGVTLFGDHGSVDPWYSTSSPTFEFFDGVNWISAAMAPVSGVKRTWEITLGAVPTRVRVSLLPGMTTGMAIYG